MVTNMSIQTIEPQEVEQQRRQGKPVELVDVRTPVEFAEVHAAGARLLPIDRLDAGAMKKGRNGEPVYLICKSGKRSTEAAERLEAAGLNVAVVSGGTEAWVQAGLPVERQRVISLERQVRLGAGLLVLLGVVLGALVSPWFLLLSGFVGAGLIFAGATDWCGMAMVLAKMPWNRKYDCDREA
jgi:rhodanese-related sulfurtransferase